VISFLFPLLVFAIIGLLGVEHPLLRYGISITLSFSSVVAFVLYILKRKNIKCYLFFLIVLYDSLNEKYKPNL
jgi:hypothetical protein